VVEPALSLARIEAGLRREPQALERLEDLVRADPERLEPRLALAALLTSAGQWGRAEEVLLAAPDPAQPAVVRGLAELDVRRARPFSAVQRLEQALERAPGLVPTRLALADAYLRVGHAAGALEEIDESARMAPNSPNVKLLRARATLVDVSASEQRLRVAGQDIADLQQQSPQDARVAQLAGLWAIRIGKTDAGIALVRKARKALADSDATLMLADTLSAVGRGEQALIMLESWLTAHPNDTAARVRRAGHAFFSGDFLLAAEDLRIALEEGAEINDGGGMLALALARSGQWPDAESAAMRTLEQTPDSPRALQAMGLVQLHRGEPDRALRSLARALESTPQSNALALDTAEAMIAAGQAGEARPLIERVLADTRATETDLTRARALDGR
jgi:tetratricopeptide (TPR) repeat protein